MRSAILVLAALVCLTPMLAQAQTPDANLRAELESLHAKWMKAFYSGDSATMDKMEASNLVLIMPMGVIWEKNGPREIQQARFDAQTQATLSDVSVRRFGDTAILTGIVHAKSAKETFQSGATIVFVKSDGKWKIASAQWTPVEEKK